MTETHEPLSPEESIPDEEVQLDPEEFVESALAFPCFNDAKQDRDSQETFDIIMTAYKEDNLTEEQDLVVELLFHLADDSSIFNLCRARDVWSDGDMEAFWYTICPEDFEEDED